MNFTEPLPLTDILERLDAKTPVGSVMRTAEWQRMPKELRDSAFFSAGVTSAQFLAAQQKQIGALIARARETNAKGEAMWQTDRARFVAEMRQIGGALGIAHPDGPREGGIKEKDIRDPLSLARLQLVVNTQLELAYGRGQYATAMNEDTLSEWPAWELVRITPRKAPRDWGKRWSEAGGTLHDGRMIALKTDPVWSKLSRFGNPHPPFDFNSGMGVEEVDRDAAESAGLMAGRGRYNMAPESQQPGLKAFQEGLEASVKDVPQEQRQRLKKMFGGQISIAGDVVKWKPTTTLAGQFAGEAPYDSNPVPRPKAGGSLRDEPDRPTPEEADLINLKEFERAIAYDADGNRVPGHADGAVDSVEVPEALRRPGFTLTHNHPHGGSFSDLDLTFMARNELKELRAIGHQGRNRRYLYRLSFEPGATADQRSHAASRYDAIYAELKAETLGQIERGERTAKAVDRDLEHWVMERLAAELQGTLIYARILLL